MTPLDLKGGIPENKAEVLMLLADPPNRLALLVRLRKGQAWILDQHNRWQADDTTAANDEAFSAAWDGWRKPDSQFRTEYGLAGCIFGPSGQCPGDFGCIGCTEAPTPVVVAQLTLLGVR